MRHWSPVCRNVQIPKSLYMTYTHLFELNFPALFSAFKSLSNSNCLKVASLLVISNSLVLSKLSLINFNSVFSDTLCVGIPSLPEAMSGKTFLSGTPSSFRASKSRPWTRAVSSRSETMLSPRVVSWESRKSMKNLIQGSFLDFF